MDMKTGTKSAPSFSKCYTALIGAFDPEEIIFLLYMEHHTWLSNRGYPTVRSQQYHMMRMAIGRRIFKQCVDRFTHIGLLELIVVDNSYDYILDMRLYSKLVAILDGFKSTMMARHFCDEFLNCASEKLLADINSEMVEEWIKKQQQ